MTNPISGIGADWKLVSDLLAQQPDGPWEVKDAPDAPFDGTFRVLGAFWPTHVHGKSFDDRAWIGFFEKYDFAVWLAAFRNAVAEALAAAPPPPVSDLGERLLRMVRTPNTSFHYREDCDTVAEAAARLSVLEAENKRLLGILDQGASQDLSPSDDGGDQCSPDGSLATAGPK